MTDTDAEFPGDVDHPDHDAFLLELGRATFVAAGLAGIAFDVLPCTRGSTRPRSTTRSGGWRRG